LQTRREHHPHHKDKEKNTGYCHFVKKGRGNQVKVCQPTLRSQWKSTEQDKKMDLATYDLSFKIRSVLAKTSETFCFGRFGAWSGATVQVTPNSRNYSIHQVNHVIYPPF
jgi:hypothetical protein